MKKIILSISILFGLNTYSQTAMPTTTVGALEVKDSLNVIKDITAQRDVNVIGEVTVRGEILAKDTLTSRENIIAKKDIKVDRNVFVKQDLMVEGNLTSKGGLTFDGTNGIKYTANANGSRTFSYGKNSTPLRVLTVCAAAPFGAINHSFDGWMQIFDGTNPATTGLLNFQTFGTKSFIDASDGGNTGNSGLLLNYFCGNNVGICTGQYGGTVEMGKNVSIGFPVNNSQTLLNLALPAGITKAISINNPAISTSINVFEVTNDGTTYIGIGRPRVGGVAANAMLSVNGLILAKEVRVAVSTTTHWADYVFEKNYKLKSLSEVEKYIVKHKHLPDVPSAEEVTENGIDMLEMNSILLKKIEELTLYTIGLQKQLDAQQKDINALKK